MAREVLRDIDYNTFFGKKLLFLRYFSIFFQETLLFLDKCDTLYNMNLKEEIKIGRYRHFKGKEYEVLFLAKHSET